MRQTKEKDSETDCRERNSEADCRERQKGRKTERKGVGVAPLMSRKRSGNRQDAGRPAVHTHRHSES